LREATCSNASLSSERSFKALLIFSELVKHLCPVSQWQLDGLRFPVHIVNVLKCNFHVPNLMLFVHLWIARSGQQRILYFQSIYLGQPGGSPLLVLSVGFEAMASPTF